MFRPRKFLPAIIAKSIYLIFLLTGIHLMGFSQTSYYVNQQNGSPVNDGLSTASAFNAINSAIAIVQPGDTIFLMGEFVNPSYGTDYTFTTVDDPKYWHGENTIRISNLHGNASGYITIKAYDTNTLLKGDGGNIFRIQNCSYLRIENLHILGEVNNIPLSTANALQFVYILGNQTVDLTNPTPAEIHYRDLDCVSNCLFGVQDGEIYSSLNPNQVYRPTYYDTRGMYLSDVHHIEILNNHIELMPGGGLRVSDCEDVLIKGNEINDCSRRSAGGTHGLVVTKATSTRTTDDYRISIIGNKIHHNYNEQFSWAPDKIIVNPHIDEGKGISLQRNQTVINNLGDTTVNWEHGRILIANNICYMNGFSGIHSNDGNRIDIINNTCYFNSYTHSITENTPSLNGGNIGISAQDGSDIRIYNNIAVIDSLQTRSAISSNLTAAEGLVVENNLIYGTTLSGQTGIIGEDLNIVALQINTQMNDPLFVDPVNFNFQLQANSPARSAAEIAYALQDDYNSILRDSQPDLGALEFTCIPASSTQSVSACESYFWAQNGQNYTASGNYSDTIQNANGCDSILVLDLTINLPAITIDTQSSTVPLLWIDGNLYSSDTTGATYTFPGGAANGCDSIVILQFTFIPTISYELLSTQICTDGSLKFYYTGTPVDEINWYCIHGGSMYGSSSFADTIYFLPPGVYAISIYVVSNGITYSFYEENAFEILQSTFGTQSSIYVTQCGSYEWHNTVYTSSGMYPSFYTNSIGCDSVVYLNLTIHPYPEIIIDQLENGNLSASYVPDYLWYDCLNDVILPDETHYLFTPQQNGQYAAIGTSEFGCTDTSDCIEVNYVGMDESLNNEFEIYPNPAYDALTIYFSSLTPASINVMDNQAKQVLQTSIYSGQNISLNGLNSGIYFVVATIDERKYVLKMIKE